MMKIFCIQTLQDWIHSLQTQKFLASQIPISSLELQSFHSPTVMRIFSTFPAKSQLNYLCQETSYLQVNHS